MLTSEEKREINKYPQIYFIGTEKSKELKRLNKVLSSRHDKIGFLKVIEGDHIAYRYEILSEIGRGAFGQVVKCIDHKTDRVVAVKLNRNDPSIVRAA